MTERFNFRVWNPAANHFLDLTPGEWGYYYLSLGGKFMVHYNKTGVGEHPLGRTKQEHLSYMVPQQYLGINDKARKEMCEGDILEWGMGLMYEIVWDKTYAKFYFPTITNQEGAYSLPAEEIRNGTICGNIFETPHLKDRFYE